MGIKVTRDQADYLVEAEKEDYINGRTDKRCPICGGKLIFERVGKSAEIRCEKEGCIAITMRGI